jgi:hypothetical protein
MGANYISGLVMFKSRPGFEAGPRPIWACQARPEARPGLGLAEARPAGPQYF